MDDDGCGRRGCGQRSNDITGNTGAAHAGHDYRARAVLAAQCIQAGVHRRGAGAADLRGGGCNRAKHFLWVDSGYRPDVIEPIVVDADRHDEDAPDALPVSGLRASSTRSTGMSSRTG